jgi:hypothetical protein
MRGVRLPLSLHSSTTSATPEATSIPQHVTSWSWSAVHPVLQAKFDLSLLNSSSDLRSTSQLRPSRHNSSSSSSGVRLADCSGGTQQRDQSSSCAGDAACGGSQVTRTSAGTPDLDMAVSSGLTAAAAAAGVAADTAAAAADGNAAAAAADARPNAVAEAGKEEYLASLRLLRMAGVKLRQHHISRAVTLGQPA